MNNWLKGLAVGSAVVSGSAMAALPAEVTTAFTDMGADVAAAGALILVATVGVIIYKYIQAVIV